MYIFSENNVTRAKLTRAEYAATGSDFKGYINGKPSILTGSKEGGSQILMVDILTQKNALQQLEELKAMALISVPQYKVIKSLLRCEEKAFFIEAVDFIYSIFDVMPKMLEQDGKGDNAIAYLHYFTANSDFYITEKEVIEGITQAFGLASVYPSDYELGYISIAELVQAGAEIDLHFTPKTLGEIKAQF